MKKMTLLLFVLLAMNVNAAQTDKFEVISDGDRGLALEWVDGGVGRNIAVDSIGSLYITTTQKPGNRLMSGYAFGENCCDAKYASYILKYSPNGGLEWVKEICTKSAMDEFHEIAIDRNGILLVNIEVSIMDSTINNSIYYDGNLISPDNRNHRKWGYQMLLQINPETGNLLNSVWINEFVYPKIKLTDRNEIIWFGLIGDGKEPVWFKKFNGYSSDNLKTDLRSKGSADFYILCMDQDLQKK